MVSILLAAVRKTAAPEVPVITPSPPRPPVCWRPPEYWPAASRLVEMSGWVMCEVHGRHWGVQGAAGLLPFAVTAGSVPVLLALRSHGTHQGGTWGTIGGAIEPGETSGSGGPGSRRGGGRPALSEARRRRATGTAGSPDGLRHVPRARAAGLARHDPFQLGNQRRALDPRRRGWQLPAAPRPGRVLARTEEAGRRPSVVMHRPNGPDVRADRVQLGRLYHRSYTETITCR